MGKIIIAGAGHGGLVAGAGLAAQGHEVAVFEKRPLQDIGYDFTDVFDAECLREVGIDYDISRLEKKADMTFVSPSKRVSLTPHIPDAYAEYRIERRELYRVLLEHARRAGVRIAGQTAVRGFTVENGGVTGVETEDGTLHRADLTVDCTGLEFSGRAAIARAGLMEFGLERGDFLYAYRATFQKGAPGKQPYKVYFYPNGLQGISWVVELSDETDVLIGCVDPPDAQTVEGVLRMMRAENPCLGEALLRGGEVYRIPVTAPKADFFCKGYALLGDSARMTIPLIGSGIANSILAGKLLADAVQDYGLTEEALWRYQSAYMQRYGWEDASLNPIKRLLLSVDERSVDYLFDRGVIQPQDLLQCCAGRELRLGAKDFLVRGARGVGRLPLMLRFLRAYTASRKTARTAKAVPTAFDAAQIAAWKRRYRGI